MPLIKSAKKKLRQDKKRTFLNEGVRNSLEKAVKKAKKTASQANVTNAVKQTDKAAKKGIIHKNKAARIKSTLSKLVKTPSSSPKKSITKKPLKTVKK